MGKALPWLISVLLAIVCGVMWTGLKQKDEEIATLRMQYGNLVQEANSKIAYANQPAVPVTASVHKAVFASGSVLQVKNTSNKAIAVTLLIERGGQRKETPLTIDAGLGKNIGENEGWAFISGDRFTITMPEHRPYGGTIP
jgi:hypothetical protein